MFFRNKKKLTVFPILLLIAIAMGFVWMNYRESNIARAQDIQTSISAYENSLTGYAWSDTTGWLSMAGSGYGVNYDDASGAFQGYAWSDNVGWVQFNPAGPYPDEPLTYAKVNNPSATGVSTVSGWIRIINMANGDSGGWISLSGSGYGVSVDFDAKQFFGFAWSDEIGWIDFGTIGRAADSWGVSLSFMPIAPPERPPGFFLKDLGYTTAETLLFTPSALKTIKQWGLLKGVGAISIAGTNLWQKSAAEVLYIGSMPLVLIDKYPKDNSRYLAAGQTTEYYIDFSASNISGTLYSTTITDTITVTPPANDGKITVVGASVEPNSVKDCQNPVTPLGSGSFVPAPAATARTITYTIQNATPGCTFRVKLSLKAADDITENISITDEADLSVEGIPNSSAFTTLAIPTYIQETVGGDIYAKKALSFGQLPTGQYGGKYVLGAGGDIQALSSQQNWLLSGYGIRSGSTTDFSPDACTISGSACKVMNDNITRLMKGRINLTQDTINSTFPSPSLSNVPPEGWVYYKNGNLTIGRTTTFQGKGTIIIENGDLLINGDMVYNDGNSMLGIIVKNGNVIIDSAVGELNAIFYIYSDGANGGSFEVKPNLSGEDIQLKIIGAVISSGKSSGGARKDAFILGRRFIGDKTKDLSNPANLEPAELFLYDSRIIVSPPPGFGGKIAGSL